MLSYATVTPYDRVVRMVQLVVVTFTVSGWDLANTNIEHNKHKYDGDKRAVWEVEDYLQKEN